VHVPQVRPAFGLTWEYLEVAQQRWNDYAPGPKGQDISAQRFNGERLERPWGSVRRGTESHRDDIWRAYGARMIFSRPLTSERVEIEVRICAWFEARSADVLLERGGAALREKPGRGAAQENSCSAAGSWMAFVLRGLTPTSKISSALRASNC
jgi:hypothetical protein